MGGSAIAHAVNSEFARRVADNEDTADIEEEANAECIDLDSMSAA